MLTCPILTEIASGGKRARTRRCLPEHRIPGCMCQKWSASPRRIANSRQAALYLDVKTAQCIIEPHSLLSRIHRDPAVTRTSWSTPSSIRRSSEFLSVCRIFSSLSDANTEELDVEDRHNREFVSYEYFHIKIFICLVVEEGSSASIWSLHVFFNFCQKTWKTFSFCTDYLIVLFDRKHLRVYFFFERKRERKTHS